MRRWDERRRRRTAGARAHDRRQPPGRAGGCDRRRARGPPRATARRPGRPPPRCWNSAGSTTCASVRTRPDSAIRQGSARVNGIRMHYVTAGQGEPLLLLHGTPKTHYYWYKLIPLLTEHFTVVAPDLRGFADTDRPTPEEGYDSRTNADDMA